MRPAPPPTGLLEAMETGLAPFPDPVRFLIAGRDRTGQAFLAAWGESDQRLQICPGATHAFVEPQARDWLFYQVLEALA